MKIVVLGAAGMLGHLTGLLLKEKYGAKVILSAREKTGCLTFDDELVTLDLLDSRKLETLVEENRPCVIVNCAAVNDARQGQKALDDVNTDLPRKLGDMLDRKNDGSRLIHISTDGVFRGDRGQYSEEDAPDADDPYGQSKQAGEVTREPHLTIRTSIIGPDPVKGRGIMDWFLSQTGEVTGYGQVFWNGVTTLELAKFIDYALTHKISGLFHLCSQKVSKYDILVMLAEVFRRNTKVVKDEQKQLDRSLISLRKDVEYPVGDVRSLLSRLKDWMSDYQQIYQRANK